MTGQAVHRHMFRFVGMSRSGNHAIIDWILAQLPGTWCFLNCVEPKSNPLDSARPRDDGRCITTTGPLHDGARKAVSCTPMDYVLFSQEDTFLKPALGPAATRIQEEGIGAAGRKRDILILRDPWNLFASRRRFGHQTVTDRTAIRIWKQHARAFVNRRCFGNPIFPISYNGWVASADYRRSIAGSLGLPGSDPGTDSVARCGGGSSFDGHAYDGRAGQMAVFDRWRHYHTDPSFWTQFDTQLAELALLAFGDGIFDSLAVPIRGTAAAIPFSGPSGSRSSRSTSRPL